MRKSILLLTILLLLTAVSCNTQQQEYYEKNPTPTIGNSTQQPVYTYDADWTPMPQPTNSKGETINGNPYKYINPERVYNIGEQIEINNFYFRINDVKMTKEMDDINIDALSEQDIKDIKNGYSFCVIDITVKNGQEEEAEYCIGNIKLWMQEKDYGYYATDTAYIEPQMYYDKHAWFYLFQPNDEVNFKVVSIVKDKYANLTEEPLYIKINALPVFDIGVEDNAALIDYGFKSYVVINKDKSEVDVYA